jgi:teichuronic acid biosynthesis glycosyltransferase TuaG
MNSLVTIILPAHNAATTIGVAIDSIIGQTHANWELIIIENGSTDNTLEECRKYSDARIQLTSLTVAGLSKARNVGLDKASGDFVCFLDADDLLPKHSLESRIRLMTEHPTVSYCDGIVEKRSENLETIYSTWRPLQPKQLNLEMHKINSACFCGVTWMVRRSQIGMLRFDESWSHLEDRLFFLKLSQTGEYQCVSEVIYIIRKTRGSLMSNHKKLQDAYQRFLTYVKNQKTLGEDELKDQKRRFLWMFFKTHIKSGRYLAALRMLFAPVYLK